MVNTERYVVVHSNDTQELIGMTSGSRKIEATPHTSIHWLRERSTG